MLFFYSWMKSKFNTSRTHALRKALHVTTRQWLKIVRLAISLVSPVVGKTIRVSFCADYCCDYTWAHCPKKRLIANRVYSRCQQNSLYTQTICTNNLAKIFLRYNRKFVKNNSFLAGKNRKLWNNVYIQKSCLGDHHQCLELMVVWV